MRRVSLIIAFVLAASLLSLAGPEQTLDQLKSHAEAANAGDKPRLFLEIANHELNVANDAFNDGDMEKGQAGVHEVVAYAELAGEAARISGKYLKQTEIGVRRIAARLDQIRRGLNFEDRAPLQTAVDRLEHVRTELLARMFDHR